MALTLIEAAKMNPGDVFSNAIIEMFARSTDILRVLPFQDIAGNALRYNREQNLPGIGFRGVNEAFPESTGILNPITEPLVITGGDLDVDRFIIQTMGANQRSVQEAMKIKALSLNWSRAFVKGDSATEPREFDGMQKRIVGRQLIDAGATAGGDALSLFSLDELIDEVDGDNKYLLMNKPLRRRLTQAARNVNVGGFIRWEPDMFGRQVAIYNDVPILIMDEDNNGNQILPFTEPAPADAALTTSSVYCCSLGDGYLTGIQNQGLGARDLGELETRPVMRTRVEWYAGVAVFSGVAAARLRGITNAPVVV